MTLPSRRSLTRSLITLSTSLLMLVLVAIGATLGHGWAERQGISHLSAVGAERLELYAAALEAELARYAYLPGLITIDADIAALLAEPADGERRQRASRTLARMNARAGSLQMLIIAADGSTLASSDTQQRARPPLPSAQDVYDFFAANPANGSTEYYFVHAVRRDDLHSPKIVIKVSLAPLEATWVDLGARSQSERLLVLDENNVIVMSSVPAWKFRTLGAPDPALLRGTGRYAGAPLLPLKLDTQVRLNLDLVLVQVTDPPEPDTRQRVAQERNIVPLTARLMTMSDPSDVQRAARQAAWGAGAGGAAAGLLLMYLAQRWRAVRQLQRARNALQQAHDQLERQVSERTSQLQSANTELTRQIEQRLLAEDELVQAGKLAVLGQMSAGLSHEINQPLTALRALSRNTIRLLDDDRVRAAADNLRLIDEMAERMGRIITQLKSFARKGQPSAGAVDLGQAVHDVLLLLDHRLRELAVQVRLDLPEGLRVQADITRLEQVLVNLVGNALDAMAGASLRELGMEARVSGARVTVAVTDTGHGVDDAAMARLLEPFFTTKPAGQGLGLGLVISSKIIHEFGGSLRARRGTVGMRFEFDLAVMQEKDNHV